MENGIEREYAYDKLWEIEPTTGPKRRVIAPSSGHIALLQTLAAGWSDGDLLLYMLVVGPLSAEDVRAFCDEYGAYLETDGRHHSADRGLVEGRVRFPAPHTHKYNPGNDEREDAILSHWEWRWCPLQDDDEY